MCTRFNLLSSVTKGVVSTAGTSHLFVTDSLRATFLLFSYHMCNCGRIRCLASLDDKPGYLHTRKIAVACSIRTDECNLQILQTAAGVAALQ